MKAFRSKFQIEICSKNYKKPCAANMELKDFQSFFPDVYTFSPRDGNINLSHTNDILFLAGLFSGGYDKYISYFHKDGAPVFLREKNGSFFHPFYDIPVNVDQTYIVKSKIARNTVMKYFREKFYKIRKDVHQLLDSYEDRGMLSDGKRDQIFKISGHLVEGAGTTVESLFKIEKKIKLPIVIDNDPFLHRISEQKFFNFSVKEKCPPKYLICPHDGFVRPRYASIHRPGNSLVGYALCPKCFGVMAETELMLIRVLY